MSAVTLVAGARPNFMKVAPILRELDARGHTTRLVHTGQHGGEAMSDVFFRDLGIRPPDATCVGLSFKPPGAASQAFVTAAILLDMEADLLTWRPDVLVVVGDVTGTLAAALAASKLGVPVAHVEAGLRSHDRTMPEEINRILVDRIAEILFAPSFDAIQTLRSEGVRRRDIYFAGNVMIDSLRQAEERLRDRTAASLDAYRPYALVTLHRPSNVDSKADLERTLGCVAMIAERIPVIWPMHPRTAQKLTEHGLDGLLAKMTGVHRRPPLGYDDCIVLMREATLVATDSGGIQEETTALGVPCLTLRTTTERPVTVIEGTNEVVGPDPGAIAEAVDDILAGKGKRGRIPMGWDGHAAARIVDVIENFTKEKASA